VEHPLVTYLLVKPLYLLICAMRLMILASYPLARLHNLFFYCFKLVANQPEHDRKFRLLGQSIWSDNRSVIDWQRRIYTSHREAWRRAVENLFVRRMLIGSTRRRRLARQGHVVPSVIAISLNTPDAGCNLTCSHCYAMGHEAHTMPYELLQKICAEQEALGMYQVHFLGGEPLLYKRIWDIVAEFPHTDFLMHTNATLLDEATVARIVERPNLYPMVSLEGFEEQTGRIRGEGVFQKVEAGMTLLKAARVPFMVTVTVTRQNIEEVSSDAFLDFISEHRAVGILYSCYVPVGRDPHPDWQISDEQSEQLDKLVDHISAHYPVMPSIGRNGTGRVTGCFAARQYFHVLPDGRVEACPFAQWASGEINMKTHTILEVTGSPFFSGVREVAGLGMPGVTPCRSSSEPALKEMFTALEAVETIR
jgi:MoaA/NifB/PqqE/SkfB family radical SAM enzyme